jgi:hypothetical protein
MRYRRVTCDEISNDLIFQYNKVFLTYPRYYNSDLSEWLHEIIKFIYATAAPMDYPA